MATLGIGTGSSRLEENPEIEDIEKEGAVHQHILPFFYFSISTIDPFSSNSVL